MKILKNLKYSGKDDDKKINGKIKIVKEKMAFI